MQSQSQSFNNFPICKKSTSICSYIGSQCSMNISLGVSLYEYWTILFDFFKIWFKYKKRNNFVFWEMCLETKWFWLSLYEKVQRKHYQDLCHNFYGSKSGFNNKLHNLWLVSDTISSLIQRWLQTGPLRLVYTLLVYFGLIWNMKPSDWHSYSGKPSTLHWITV